MVRALLLQQAKRELTRIVHPPAGALVKPGGAVVEARVMQSVRAFM